MKKLVVWLLAAMLAFASVACAAPAEPQNNDPKPTADASATEPADTEKTDFPSKPITMVVQSNPGGLSDQVSQQIAMLMSKDLGVNVTCVYKPGASGAIGMTYVEASAPDGYTIGHAPIEYTMIKTLGFSNIEPGSCTFLGQAYATIPALTINADETRFSTVEELIAYAKEHPGELKVGNAGVGSLWQLAAIGIEETAGVTFNHVPFDGAAAAATALMGGHIDAVAIAPIEVKAGVDAGKLNIIAVLGEERAEAYPDVPTLKECGVDYTLTHWGGFIAPAGLDPEVEKILTDSLQRAVESEEFKTFLNERAMEPKFRTGDEVNAFVQEQYDYFTTALPAALSKQS